MKFIVSIRLFAAVTLLVLTVEVSFQSGYVDAQTSQSLSDFYYVQPAWSPDGSKIAVASDTAVIIINAQNGSTIFTLTGHSQVVYDIAWSPDGSWLATASRDGTVIIWNADSGANVRALSGHVGGVDAVTWSADSARIVSVNISEMPNLYVWNANNGTFISNYPSGLSSSIAFNNAGSRFVYVTGGGSVNILDGSNFSFVASHRTGVTDRTNMMYSVSWKNDDTQFVTGSVGGSVYVWNAVTAEPLMILSANSHYSVTALGVAHPELSWVRDAVFSPNGSQIISVSADGTLRRWNSSTGQLLDDTSLGVSVRAASWSPDNSQLAYVNETGNLLIVTSFGVVPIATPTAH